MIETVEHYDFKYAYNSDTETVSFQLRTADPLNLENVKLEFNILEYDPELYERIALSMRRIAQHLRTEYEQYEE